MALGEELVRDDRAAIEELVKNSYDADARNISVIFETSPTGTESICISDNGHGMSLSDLRDKWLVVATPNKLQTKRSAGGRVVTGSKGIGRLASARLGAGLELFTRTRQDNTIRLQLDWSALASAKTISDFRVLVEEVGTDVKELQGKNSGTFIRISNLRRPWLVTSPQCSDLDDLERFLSRIVNPFAAQSGVQLSIKVRGIEHSIRELQPSEFLEHPHYRLEGEVLPDGRVHATYHFGRSRRTIARHPTLQRDKIDIRNCGPFSFDFRVWDRDVDILSSRASEHSINLNASAMRSILDQNSGIFIYRDGILAYPKRDNDRDWLGLSRRRINNPTQRIGISNIVGAAFITREWNSELKDKSDREGIVDNAALREFKSAMDAILQILETERQVDKPPMGRAKAQPQAEVHIDLLNQAALDLKNGRMSADALFRIITDESKRLSQVQEDLKSRIAILGRLAAVGQLSGVLVHEISQALPSLGESLRRATEANAAGKPAEKFLERARESVRSIQRVVQRFAPFFVGGVRTRQRPSDPLLVARAAVETRAKAVKENGVEVEIDSPQQLPAIRMDAGDALAIASNLLDNAIYWAARGGTIKKVVLRLRAHSDHLLLTVSDSGPGIEDAFLSRIFEPGFTTRRGGMGLGLAIVRDILVAHEGSIEPRAKSRLGGAELEVKIPLESSR